MNQSVNLNEILGFNIASLTIEQQEEVAELCNQGMGFDDAAKTVMGREIVEKITENWSKHFGTKRTAVVDYPVAISKCAGEEGYLLNIPDIPASEVNVNCKEFAKKAAHASIIQYLLFALENGETVPAIKPLEERKANPDYKDFEWHTASVEFELRAA